VNTGSAQPAEILLGFFKQTKHFKMTKFASIEGFHTQAKSKSLAAAY
jgi:hypothetical protein